MSHSSLERKTYPSAFSLINLLSAMPYLKVP
jgi:hypothetical protein